MQQGRRCNNQPMTIVDRKWINNQEPSDNVSYLVGFPPLQSVSGSASLPLCL